MECAISVNSPVIIQCYVIISHDNMQSDMTIAIQQFKNRTVKTNVCGWAEMVLCRDSPNITLLNIFHMGLCKNAFIQITNNVNLMKE